MRRSASVLLRSFASSEQICPGACCSFSFTALSLESEENLGYAIRTIHAQPRSRSGKQAVKQYRKAGRVPAILYSLPGEVNQLITLDKKETDRLIANYGRRGVTSRLFSLQLTDGGKSTTYPVLPRMVHQTATNELIENITFLYCPPDRIVRVEVPVKVLGEDVSPGVKKGGFVNMIRTRIKCICQGSFVPPYLEIDVSALDLGGKLGLAALDFPLGVLLNERHLEDPVCRIAGRATRE